MKKQAGIIFLLWILSGLTACNLPVRPDIISERSDVSQQYQTISALLTGTALARGNITQVSAARRVERLESSEKTPAPTPSVIDQETPPANTRTPEPVALQANVTPEGRACDLAHPGRPIDITIPDDTQMRPGEYFSKVWRLENVGSCDWTSAYSVVWFSGDDLGINRTQPFNTVVKSGHTVDITVDMTAPETPGTYQSNWKLRNSQGDLFGIGPNGSAPFWVRIVVVLDETPTPTATFAQPTPTQTPVVLLEGAPLLKLEDGIDLDSGDLNLAEQNDLVFQSSEGNGLILAPVNGARLAPVGEAVPGFRDCLIAPLSEDSVRIEDYPPGAFFCYKTTGGLPGRFQIMSLDAASEELVLQFTTWTVP